jgi:hypothetical protein
VVQLTRTGGRQTIKSASNMIVFILHHQLS